MSERPATLVTAPDSMWSAQFVRFVQTLIGAASVEQLGRAFIAGFPRLVDVPIYGFNVCEPDTMRLEHNVAPSVSDVFNARYNRELWDDDPLRTGANSTRRPVYNLGLMSAQEWGESFAYRRAFSLHQMRHVVEAPMIGTTGIVGNLHFASSDPEHEFGPHDLELAEALAGVLASVIEGIRSRERIEQERRRALAALELTDTAIVVSDPQSVDLELNRAAQRLLGATVDGEQALHRALVRPAGDTGPFSRRIETELMSGEPAVLHTHSIPTRSVEGGLVTVLELQRDSPLVIPGLLRMLTPRESEVAVLVVEGLGDREIADRLHLSRYTVSQHVRQIYRKLGVDSRVALTRLLIGSTPSAAHR